MTTICLVMAPCNTFVWLYRSHKSNNTFSYFWHFVHYIFVSVLVILSGIGGKSNLLVMSEARYVVSIANICIFQLTMAWIASLTNLHALVMLIITEMFLIYQAFDCLEIEINPGVVV